jgi:transketolase
MRHNPADPELTTRDRLLFSKGHAGAALYAVLAECGYFPVAELATHCHNGSRLSGHVSHRGVPGVELSTGSLGHGLSVGAGLAHARQRRRLGFRTFVVLSDGECDEGSVWEAALFAGHHALSSLVAIVDYNGLQSLGSVTDTLELEPFADKWRAFGWDAVEVDGHNVAELSAALAEDNVRQRPLCVVARTVKGKGVSFMEGSVLWHYRPPSADEVRAAIAELVRDE